MARSEEEIDFASRQLCPDGACIGVLGANGRCKVCGKEGIRPTTSQQVDEVLDDHEVDDDDEPAAEAAGDEEPAAFDEERVLCPDGACVGLIGSDGKCKVCGRARGT